MKHLPFSDLQLLLSAIEQLNSDVETDSLPERALCAAAKIIEADSVTFTGFGGGEYAGLLWDTGTISAEEMEIFARYMYENPLVGAYVVERRLETLTVTDLIRREEYQRTNVYNEFYRRIGVESQLVAPLPISDDLFMSCSVNTGRQEFSGRDKLILTLLAPHLSNAVRNALAYERLSSALETERCGVVAVNSEGKPLFFSEYARRLIEKYFAGEKRENNFLPETLASRLRQIESTAKTTTDFNLPPAPLKITNPKGALTVRFMYNAATKEKRLLLEEKEFLDLKALEGFNLTKRETEILFLITRGKTDDVIASLCNIGLRTVHKHVEHIYTKLGVETRTAAMLRVLEVK